MAAPRVLADLVVESGCLYKGREVFWTSDELSPVFLPTRRLRCDIGAIGLSVASAGLLTLARPELSRRFACRENLAAGGILGVAVPLEPASGRPHRLPDCVRARFLALRPKGIEAVPLVAVS